MNEPTLSRRQVVAQAAVAGAAVGVLGLAEAAKPPRAQRRSIPKSKSMLDVPFERRERVRVGLIGVGGRGQSLLGDLLNVPSTEIAAICDIVPDRLRESQAAIAKAGKPAAAEYGRTETDFERLNARDDLDLVVIATPWNWHVPMALSGMKNGKHVGVEVPAATTLDDCWKLVETSEATRRHCVMLENVCYGYNELLYLNMVRAGLLGELTHGEAAYIHDLRGILLGPTGEGVWRWKPHTVRNGNLYPTHGLGPVANYMGVHRGDRFESMVSLSSREAALSAEARETLPPESPKRKAKFVTGDMNTSVLRTALGRTILLQHDVVTPRPYSRINKILGSRGVLADFPARVFLEGRTPNDDWEPIDAYKAEYEHPLWRKEGDTARKLGGHGGMDYIMSYRLIQCMREGLPPDMDVYDAAAWSAPGPLSEASVAKGGAPQRFPDFTRGNWSGPRPAPVTLGVA